MKICFITATMAGGGAERVIATLANEFVRRGNEVAILLTTNCVVEYTLLPEVKIIQISEKTGKSIRKRIRRIYNLRSYFKKNRKVVYISMPTDTNMFVLLASCFLNIKLVISERNDPNRYGKSFLRNIIYLMAKKIVFQTNDAKKCFPAMIQKRGVVIMNPLRQDIPAVYSGNRTKRFVAVGRLEEQKNHSLLIDAFSILAKENSEYTLDIYGKGSLESSLRQKINNLGLSDRIHLLGFSKDVWKEAADAEVYILSSNYEGMPNSLIEAMAMGMAVITTDCPIGGSRMLINEDINGILVPTENKRALYEAMRFMIKNSLQVDTFRKEAVKVRERLSVQKISEEWNFLLERL